ncbi:MFS transporter [Streptomyces sp. M10(2022)]
MVATLAFAGTVAAVMQTLVTPLIGELPQILNTTPSNSAWVITVTLLVAAVCVPVTGRLGDLLGKRRMLLACSVPLFVGSVVCALASSVVPMIIGRGLQGMGMGMVPIGIALLRDVVAKEKLSSSVALVSASMGIGGALGLPIAAAVAQYANWRVLFWGSAVLALLILALVWFLIPDVPAGAKGSASTHPAPSGWPSAWSPCCSASPRAPSGAGAQLRRSVFSSPPWWCCWPGASGSFGPGTRWSTCAPRPAPVLFTNLASLFVGFGMYASMLIVPQLLQFPEATGYGLGESMLTAGLWMAPGGVMMMLISPLGGKLTDSRGPKFTLLSGVLIIAAAYGLGIVLMGSAWGLMLFLMVSSSGVGLAYGAMPALIMSSVPLSETAAANGFNTLMRSLGTSIGAAVIGVVLSQMTNTVGGVSFTSEAVSAPA